MSISKSISVAEVGSKVHMHFLNTLDGSGTYSEYNLYTKTTSAVVLNNGKSIVLDNANHTSVALVSGIGVQLEKPLLIMRFDDSVFGNSLDFLLFTEKELTNKELEEMVKSEVASKLESMSGFDLSAVSKLLGRT